MTGMALNPVPVHLVMAERLVKPLPQVNVLDRLLIRRTPTVLFPAVNPGRDSVLEIFAVGMEVDRARALERFQRRDGSHQLHTIVRRMRLAAHEFLDVIAERENRAPAARSRIARAGTIRVNGHALLGHQSP